MHTYSESITTSDASVSKDYTTKKLDKYTWYNNPVAATTDTADTSTDISDE